MKLLSHFHNTKPASRRVKEVADWVIWCNVAEKYGKFFGALVQLGYLVHRQTLETIPVWRYPLNILVKESGERKTQLSLARASKAHTQTTCKKWKRQSKSWCVELCLVLRERSCFESEFCSQKVVNQGVWKQKEGCLV